MQSSNIQQEDRSVDVVILSRTSAPVSEELRVALKAQRGVRVQVFRVIGNRHPDDVNRWQTIARARNHGRNLGTAPWLLFLDDDVIPDADCIRTLIDDLHSDPGLAISAANYNRQTVIPGDDPHVVMGCALFRRCVLSQFEFRFEANVCECGCCANDLRKIAWRIAYSQRASAIHRNVKVMERLKLAEPVSLPEMTSMPSIRRAKPAQSGRILVAFDRRHLNKFRNLFLPTLRRCGNAETVSVIAYGLYPSERNRLSRLAGVNAHFLPVNGTMAPRRRLLDFQSILSTIPVDTPVACWDAGDVVFQSPLGPLWEIVAGQPDRLLACAEPKWHPQNPAVRAWTMTIRNPVHRDRTFEIVEKKPFLNSGFCAGTAAVLRSYCCEADRLLHGPELEGSADWGDQMALNLFCHSDPRRWLRIEDGWNYCIHDRRNEIYVDADGFIRSRRGTPIYVAHGNAKSLRQFELMVPATTFGF